jgi:hypothetical protein
MAGGNGNGGGIRLQAGVPLILTACLESNCSLFWQYQAFNVNQGEIPPGCRAGVVGPNDGGDGGDGSGNGDGSNPNGGGNGSGGNGNTNLGPRSSSKAGVVVPPPSDDDDGDFLDPVSVVSEEDEVETVVSEEEYNLWDRNYSLRSRLMGEFNNIYSTSFDCFVNNVLTFTLLKCSSVYGSALYNTAMLLASFANGIFKGSSMFVGDILIFIWELFDYPGRFYYWLKYLNLTLDFNFIFGISNYIGEVKQKINSSYLESASKQLEELESMNIHRYLEHVGYWFAYSGLTVVTTYKAAVKVLESLPGLVAKISQTLTKGMNIAKFLVSKTGYLITKTGAFLVARVDDLGRVFVKIKDILWHVRSGGRSLEDVLKVVKDTSNALAIRVLSRVIYADPKTIRFSQSGVSKFQNTLNSMQNGWNEMFHLDTVRMPDGILTSVDNRRLLAAQQKGIRPKIIERGYNEPIDLLNASRMPNKTTGELPKTWGQAISNRINRQGSATWKNANPNGSFSNPKIKYD